MAVSCAAAVVSVICCDGMPWLQTAAGFGYEVIEVYEVTVPFFPRLHT